MKNLKKKFIQEWAVKKMKLIISLFVFMFAGLIPVHLKAHDTSQPKPAWWTGKHLKLTYSANDNVCREMLEYFDKKYKPTSEMFRPNHEIDLDKMEWYDDHPWMIQKWQRVKNIKDYSSFINLAEMDTNGDGYKEIILRNIGMGRIYDTSPFQNIQIFTLEGGLDEFLAAQWKKVDGGRIINADTGMELINRKINERDDSFVELKFHPNYDPNKTEISANPSYSQTFLGGIQHPFSYQGEGYIAYIQPRTDFDQGKIDIAHWGLIQKVTKFWDKHDICYIAQLR